VVSPSAKRVLEIEVDPDRQWVRDGNPVPDDMGLSGADVRCFSHGDIAAPAASGTALRRGMVIVPCSMGTLGRIASGVSMNLVDRAADVCLKERRRMVAVIRETPLSRVHVQNMLAVTEAGGIILPAAPGFYHRPEGIEQLLDHVSAKVLDCLDVPHDIIERWGGA